MHEYPACGCRLTCGDLDESHDDPDAVCKGLRRGDKSAPVEIVVVHRDDLAASRDSQLDREET